MRSQLPRSTRVMPRRLPAVGAALAVVAAAIVAPAGRASAALSYSATATIALSASPVEVAVDGNVHRAYVATAQQSLLVLDTSTNSVVGSVPIGGEPGGVALDTNRPPVAKLTALELPAVITPPVQVSAPLVYVSSTSGATITVIDGGTDTVSATINLAPYTAQGLAMDPSTHTLYAADGFDNLLLVINGSTDKITTTIPISGFPSRVAIDAAAHKVFVASASAVSVVDTTSNAVTETMPGNGGDVAVDPTAHRIYVPGNNSVAVLDENAGTLLTTVSLNVSPSRVAVDPGAHRLFVSFNEALVVDTALSPMPPAVAVSGTENAGSIAVDPVTHAVYALDFADNRLYVVHSGPVVSRLAGSDRFGTAVAVSKQEFPAAGAGAVVLARGDDYPDALVGAPLARAKSAPLLLTSGATLPTATKAEILRVLALGKTIYVLGGPAAVPVTVTDELTSLGYQVTRVAGATRFATAVQVADALGDPGRVLLATGTNFPDALSAGVAAATVDGAVLLTSGATLPTETSAYLTAHATTVYAVGGPAATADPAAVSLVGVDRYATSVAVARQFFPNPTTVGVATGLSFPDALAGGGLLGRVGAPLVLVASGSAPVSVVTYLSGVEPRVTRAYLFGGTSTVSAAVETALNAALTPTS